MYNRVKLLKKKGGTRHERIISDCWEKGNQEISRVLAEFLVENGQIELFFKTLKQQFMVKSFVGTSENALLSQLWVALIAYLFLSYLKFKSRFQWSLYTLSNILPMNLFSRRNLWDWLNTPRKRSKRLAGQPFSRAGRPLCPR